LTHLETLLERGIYPGSIRRRFRWSTQRRFRVTNFEMRFRHQDRRRQAVAAAVVALVCVGSVVGVVATSTEKAPTGGSTGITVLAAASLTDVLSAIDEGPSYSFGGSNALATQIANGAPADVFLSANTAIPDDLNRRGLVEKPVVFARNALVVVVPKGNPGRVTSVDDLARPGTKVVVAAADVPVGKYTRQVLERLHLADEIEPNVVSHETDVRGVLAKVQLGQGDAGFVYSTDAKTVPGGVETIDLPASSQPQIDYAVVSSSGRKQAARKFVGELRGRPTQAVLTRFGFGPANERSKTDSPD
jgi:molybdate transport system substrate-binding protein